MTAHEFLRLLFGHPSLENLYVPLWFKGINGVNWHETFPVSELKAAAAAALRASDKADVYVRVTPIGFIPEGDARGKAKDARALVAVFADLDVAGEGHVKKKLPPDANAAFDLAYECARPPSAIVGSGGGLHVWWIFREPLPIVDDESLREAQTLAEGWEDHIQQTAEPHGWEIDSVSDLSRVLRIPGTKNHKTPAAPKPVEVVECR